MASGLSVGLAGVAAGYTIGIVGDAVSGSRRLVSYLVQLLITLEGRACVHATIEGLCRHDSDPHFRRGSWSLWVGFGARTDGRSRQYADGDRLIVGLILNSKSSG